MLQAAVGSHRLRIERRGVQTVLLHEDQIASDRGHFEPKELLRVRSSWLRV